MPGYRIIWRYFFAPRSQETDNRRWTLFKIIISIGRAFFGVNQFGWSGRGIRESVLPSQLYCISPSSIFPRVRFVLGILTRRGGHSRKGGNLWRREFLGFRRGAYNIHYAARLHCLTSSARLYARQPRFVSRFFSRSHRRATEPFDHNLKFVEDIVRPCTRKWTNGASLQCTRPHA